MSGGRGDAVDATLPGVDEALRQVLLADGRIAYALRFGSTARGEATPLSDVDVAVGLRSGATLDAHALGALTSALEQAAGRPVDLVVLDEAPLRSLTASSATVNCSWKSTGAPAWSAR